MEIFQQTETSVSMDSDAGQNTVSGMEEYKQIIAPVEITAVEGSMNKLQIRIIMIS